MLWLSRVFHAFDGPDTLRFREKSRDRRSGSCGIWNGAGNPAAAMDNPVLVNVIRGATVESRHRGAVVVLDPDGGVAFSAGDIDAPVFPRSAVKAIQALPLIESGAADRFRLAPPEIALACASHNGEPRHVAAASSMLTKAGIDAGALECGTQWPMAEKVSRALAAEGRTPNALHNNCSGKHSGFLCVCCAQGLDTGGYVKAGHKLQDEIRGCLEAMTGAAHKAENRGTDGCSIPTYAVPLRSLALAFARFGTGAGLEPERAKATRRIREAIAEAPEMVAGEDRFDTSAMRIFGSRLMVKVGAEGVYCGTLPELGLGVAIKCDDGNGRAAEVAMAAVIDLFLEKSESEAQKFEPLVRPILRNWNGIHVGSLTASAVFSKR